VSFCFTIFFFFIYFRAQGTEFPRGLKLNNDIRVW